MAIRLNIAQLPAALLWIYYLFTLLTGRNPGYIMRSLDEEQARLADYFDHAKDRLEETIDICKLIIDDFFDGDGYFDGSLITKAMSLLFGGVFLFFMKLHFVWRRLNYIAIVMFYYSLQMFLHVFVRPRTRS